MSYPKTPIWKGCKTEELPYPQKAVEGNLTGESNPALQPQEGQEVGLGPTPFFLLASDFRLTGCPVGGCRLSVAGVRVGPGEARVTWLGTQAQAWAGVLDRVCRGCWDGVGLQQVFPGLT